MHHRAALTRESGDAALAEAVVSDQFDQLDDRLRALLEYAIALTLSPHQVQQADVQRLERVGLSARDIIDANQVASYFNYVNRVAEGLGVELEDSCPEELRRGRRYPLHDRSPGSGHSRPPD